MSRVIYVPPAGDEKINPTISEVVSIIEESDEAYWTKGSADAGLTFEDHGRRTQLIIRFREALGFSVYFEPGSKGLPLVVSEEPNNTELVELEESGNRVIMPRSHFVSRAVAAKAIREFMKTGRPAGELTWIEYSPLEP